MQMWLQREHFLLSYFKTLSDGMLLIPGTRTGEPGTGVWELMYSGNPLENSKWRSKQKKGSKRNDLGKGEFPPAVPPDAQYVIVRAESD